MSLIPQITILQWIYRLMKKKRRDEKRKDEDRRMREEA
jgi:hypothetical protein